MGKTSRRGAAPGVARVLEGVDGPTLGWESCATEHTVAVTFTSDIAEVRRARRVVQAQLEAWGYGTEVEAMTLAVSELVTNAVIHGRGDVELTLTANDGTIRIEVTDQGGGQPKLVPQGAHIVGAGWGLHLVDALADQWGSVRNGVSTSVWMERRWRTGRGDEPDRGSS
jgi:anti-sigma regulatory factor (Ser/Thr protein kinase)